MDKVKAWVAGGVAVVTTFLTGVSVALEDGAVTQSEWLTVAIATVGSFGAVFAGTYAAPKNQYKGDI
jgi:hypothetical protein